MTEVSQKIEQKSSLLQKKNGKLISKTVKVLNFLRFLC